jgi:hypothetical protein
MKTCCQCKQEKPKADFHRNKSTRDGLQKYCAECAKKNNYNEKPKIKIISKKCPRCGQEKPANKFRKNASKKDDLQSYCADCMSIIHIKSYKIRPRVHRSVLPRLDFMVSRILAGVDHAQV